MKGPRTWGSGNSAPEDVADQRLALAGVVAIAFLLAPLGTLVAAATYQIGLVILRLRYPVLLVGAGVSILVWRFSGLFSWHQYWTGHRELFAAVRDPDLKVATVVADEWFTWLLLEFPTAFAFGTLVGAMYSWYRWYRRPSWEAENRRPYPHVGFRTKKIIRSIAADLDGPACGDGITIGVDPIGGARVVQSDAEGGSHTLVTGGSGTGKTTAILMGMRDVIRQGRGLVLLDLKGSDDMPEQIEEWCARHGRVFHHWTFQSNLEEYKGPASSMSYYEPVGRGDATRRAGMLLATREWSAESDHYKKIVEGFLQTAFNLMERTPDSGKDAIADMVALSTDPMYLIDRAQKLFKTTPLAPTTQVEVDAEKERVFSGAPVDNTEPWQSHWNRAADEDTKSLFQFLNSYINVNAAGNSFTMDETVKQFGQSLNTFKQSIAGRYLRKDPTGLRNIDLSRVAREGQVVVFSLNSSNYSEPAAALGTMIIQDLKTVSSELRGDPVWFRSQDPRDRLHVYIDEFGALKADNTKTLLQQVRDARISVSLSTQSVSDLAYHSPEFKDALLNTVASFLALRPNTHDEAEELAGLSGGLMRTVKQIGIEQSTSIGGIDTGAATGGGFLRDEMGFAIEPHTFQDLKIGEAVYISSGDGARRALKVKVIREDPAVTALLPKPGVELQDPDPVNVTETSGDGAPLPPGAGSPGRSMPTVSEVVGRSKQEVAAGVIPANPGLPSRPGATAPVVSTNVDPENLVPSPDGGMPRTPDAPLADVHSEYVAPRPGAQPLFDREPVHPAPVGVVAPKPAPAAPVAPAPVVSVPPPVQPGESDPFLLFRAPSRAPAPVAQPRPVVPAAPVTEDAWTPPKASRDPFEGSRFKKPADNEVAKPEVQLYQDDEWETK